MPSAAYKAAFYAPSTGDLDLYLVRLDHPALTTPVRVVGDHVALVHQGETYHPAGFTLQLPEQGEGVGGRARIGIQNLDPELVTALRAAQGPATVTIREVLASEPDAVQNEWPDFELVEASWDAVQVEGDLSYADLDAQAFGDVFVPSQWSGLR